MDFYKGFCLCEMQTEMCICGKYWFCPHNFIVSFPAVPRLIGSFTPEVQRVTDAKRRTQIWIRERVENNRFYGFIRITVHKRYRLKKNTLKISLEPSVLRKTGEAFRNWRTRRYFVDETSMRAIRSSSTKYRVTYTCTCRSLQIDL